jgi:hypothetical protein
MTEQKHLKRLVRERMARTGESYSTARRHVVAGLAAAGGATPGGATPAGATPGLPARHRLSALVADLLRGRGYVAPHTGEPYSEAMVCGLAGGIGFLYATFEYAPLPPILTIVAQHHPEPWAPAALTHLGVPFTVEHSTRPGPAAAALDAVLASGRPALCAVDRGGLPWHADAPGMATDPYHVLVTGRDGDAYLVRDDADEPRRVDRATFVAAWSAHRKGRHGRLTLDPTTGVAPATTADLGDAVRAAVGTTVGHLTGPVLGNAFDVNFGLSGMARLADQLADRRTKSGWAKRFAAPEAFAAAMLRLHDCLEVEYTAPGGTRPLYADFLAEAAGVLADRSGPTGAGPTGAGPTGADAIAAAALFRESGAVWSGIADRAAETADAMGDLPALAWRRILGAASGGPAAGADDLAARIGALARDPGLPTERERLAALDDLADRVRRAHDLEAAAVAALAPATG